jgi:hypothetical protein
MDWGGVTDSLLSWLSLLRMRILTGWGKISAVMVNFAKIHPPPPPLPPPILTAAAPPSRRLRPKSEKYSQTQQSSRDGITRFFYLSLRIYCKQAQAQHYNS